MGLILIKLKIWLVAHFYLEFDKLHIWNEEQTGAVLAFCLPVLGSLMLNIEWVACLQSSCLPAHAAPSENLCSSAHNRQPLTNPELISIGLRCLWTSQLNILAARSLFENCGWFCFKINYQKPEERKALKIWVVQIPKYLYFSNLLIVYFSTTKPHREGNLLFSVKHREKLQVCECWSQRQEVNLWDSLHGKMTQGLCITT